MPIIRKYHDNFKSNLKRTDQQKQIYTENRKVSETAFNRTTADDQDCTTRHKVVDFAPNKRRKMFVAASDSEENDSERRNPKHSDSKSTFLTFSTPFYNNG